MKSMLANLRSPALISSILVLPFVILEFIFNSVNTQSARGLIVLIGFLWLLPMAFIVLLAPIVRSVRGGNSIMANPMGLLVRLPFLALIAFVWSSLMIDQMPCFFGVPNCD